MPPLTPDIVRRQAVIGVAALSPDGSRVVYTRRTVAGERYQTSLWIVPYSGGRPRRLTSGRWSDGAPAWSPDGETIAFTSDRGDEDTPAALYLIRPDGGEAQRVCAAPHGDVGAPVWSPDGGRIAFVAKAGAPRFWAGDPKRRTARVIRTVDWRNDEGERDYRVHLFVVAARPGARPVQVTTGDFDIADPAWHPDGRRIAFAAPMGTDADLDPRPAIHSVKVKAGARPRPVVSLAGVARLPAWSPDGRLLAFIGTDVAGAPDHAELELYVWDGTAARSLTGALDLPVALGFGSDLHDWMGPEEPPPAWDGAALVVPINRRGRDEVWRVPLEGDPHPLTAGDTSLTVISVAAGRIVSTLTDDVCPPEICAVEPDRLRRLTRHGGAWLRRHEPPVVREVDAGGVPSFLFEPAGVEGRSALVLAPHGGPYGAHAPTPELDTWVLTSLGYRVLAPNIRGSGGYGRDWVEPIQGRWGGPDADDLMAATEWAVRRRLADPKRIAVMGLSYGGWAANWLAGTSSRFACVISENGVASLPTAHAVSHIGPSYDRSIGYGPVYEHEAAMAASSPLRHVQAMTAPMLMLQGEADRICPIDDNWQLFVALRELGRDVEMVLYPDEHHVMMATARPDRRIDRLERIIAFLRAHCPP
ncbi:MAG TPA: S9 family peptidase [Gaiellales bacterium]|jgi:dipeptidyl aminopeptidase/acylaminoacyl peptidase